MARRDERSRGRDDRADVAHYPPNKIQAALKGISYPAGKDDLVRTAKEKSFVSSGAPSNRMVPNAAAWPSMAWLIPRSFEYSCRAPTTRPCCWEMPTTTIHLPSALTR